MSAVAPNLLTARDVAERLAVSRKHVYHLLDSGRLAGVRLGPRCIRVHPAALAAFVESAGGPADRAHLAVQPDAHAD